MSVVRFEADNRLPVKMVVTIPAFSINVIIPGVSKMRRAKGKGGILLGWRQRQPNVIDAYNVS